MMRALTWKQLWEQQRDRAETLERDRAELERVTRELHAALATYDPRWADRIWRPLTPAKDVTP